MVTWLLGLVAVPAALTAFAVWRARTHRNPYHLPSKLTAEQRKTAFKM